MMWYNRPDLNFPYVGGDIMICGIKQNILQNTLYKAPRQINASSKLNKHGLDCKKNIGLNVFL